MYDQRSELREFVGANRAEAVSKAASFFGLPETDLDVFEPPPGEVYGLSVRAVVVAGPKGRRPAAMARSGGEREGERERGGRDRERGRDRGPRGEGGRDRDRDRDRGRDRERGREREREPEREIPVRQFAPAEAQEPSVGTAASPMSRIGEYVLGIVERMEVGPFEISESVEGDLAVIAIQGAAAVGLSAGDGRAVDAVALLANQAAANDGDDAKRVVLDVNGDQDRREDYLGKLAEKAARRAMDTGRSVAIDPMNPRDRRIIHVALREQEGVATMSVGVGRYRQVVVVPEGAPEFEEARRQASSSRRDE